MSMSDAEKLTQWFLNEKRDLPWRRDTSPYRVWISEIMLQQTRASVVIGYFEKWMKQFPSINELANATEEAVIKAWEGLGYYNRARNILKAARYFQSVCGGVIPSDKQALMLVPGLGPYTVGAILSFAFKQKQAAVDANVARVMSRYHAYDKEISTSKAQKWLEEVTQKFLPDTGPHIVMEGLIELGAKICGKTPQCLKCPLDKGCKALLHSKVDSLPIKKKAKETIYLYKDVIVLKRGKHFLVHMKEKGKVLGGLYEFISVERQETRDIRGYLKENFGMDADKIEELGTENYGYTHHAVELFPSIWETSSSQLIPGCEWKTWQELLALPFTSGHRRILAGIAKEKYEYPTY
jgi:A/G-specific adenine glycosylase